MNIKIEDILNDCGGNLLAGSPSGEVTGISIDSREVRDGDLFVAIIGEKTDAHKYLPQVIAAGVSCILVSEPEKVPEDTGDACVVGVEDTVTALQEIAKKHVERLPGLRRIAVTGSVGKTSTRDMIWHILASRWNAGRPKKNFNSLIGLPIAALGFDESMDAAVFEEGTGGPGDIARLTDISRPEAAVITNVTVAHLELFGSREKLRDEKLSIAKDFGPGNILVVNADNDMLAGFVDEVKSGRRKIDYKLVLAGQGNGCDYRISDVEERGTRGIRFNLTVPGGETAAFELPVPGAHNALNAALAAAVTAPFGFTAREAAAALKNMELTGKRLKYRKGRDGVIILDDSYNASPDSMISAIDSLMHTEGKRHLAFLGDMLELGPAEEEGHRSVGRKAAGSGMDLLAAVGSRASAIAEEAEKGGVRVLRYADTDQLVADLPHIVQPGDVVLTKGSNLIGLSRAADALADPAEEDPAE